MLLDIWQSVVIESELKCGWPWVSLKKATTTFKQTSSGGCFIGCFNPPERACQQKNIILINRIANQYEMLLRINETAPKFGCFVGFCHHHWVTMSAHVHVYHYPLFDKRMKTGLWTVILSRKDIALCITQTQITTVK